MRILKSIKSKDRLAELFNAYSDALETLEIISWPGYYSMKELNETLMNDNESSRFVRSALNLTDLIVFNEAIHSIHDCIIRTIVDIENYQNNFNSDWKNYAIQNRIDSLNEWGGGDSSDWNFDDTVKYSEEYHKIIGHSFWNDLAFYFGRNDNRGEYIGTSTKEEYSRLTIMVRNKSDFCITKFFQSQGEHLDMYKPDDLTGEMAPMSIAERVENEINQDIKNGDIAFAFEYIIDKCIDAKQFFNSIEDGKDEKEKYAELKRKLEAIRDLKF